MDPSSKPLVIPVFIPQSGCPHACAFCNQAIITSQQEKLPDQAGLDRVVAQYLPYKGLRNTVELAFFGGNFLGLAPTDIHGLLEMVVPYLDEKKINGIRFSTRPDTITPQTLDLIRSYPISAVEIGVQSMNDSVLIRSKRGHTAMDTVRAIDLLKKNTFKIGAQVMVGLPGDDEGSLMESTQKLAALAPDFARIYPLMVLKDSLMAVWYGQGRYQPLGLEDSVVWVKHMLEIFMAAGVRVIRMGLQASEMMADDTMVLAGPWHPAFGHLVFAQMMYDRACEKIDSQGKITAELTLMVHPRSVSRLRGDKNSNMKKLAQKYPGLDFSIQVNESISIDQVEVKQ